MAIGVLAFGVVDVVDGADSAQAAESPDAAEKHADANSTNLEHAEKIDTINDSFSWVRAS